MNQAQMKRALEGLLQQRQRLEDNARAVLGLEIRVELRAYAHDAETSAQVKLYRQLFDATLAHPDGDYVEYNGTRWGEVNHPEDEFSRYLTVFTDLPPSSKQLKALASRKTRKEKKR